MLLISAWTASVISTAAAFSFNQVRFASRVSSAATNADWSTNPFNPTAIPLAVRSPYVNSWLWSGNHATLGDLSSQWSSFFNGNYLPWCGVVRVDGNPFTFMGTPGLCAPGKAIQQSMNFTASKSTFVMRAGAVDVTLEFLSPITPLDLVRQSLPYSYLSIAVSSNDGQPHNVQMYTDIGAEWICGDWTRQVNWNTALVDGIVRHTGELTEQDMFGEVQDFSLAGQTVYATAMTSATTWQTGSAAENRGAFAANGLLANIADSNFRTIEDNPASFAFANDFGDVTSLSEPVRYTIGHFRDPAASWTAVHNDFPDRSLYFMTQYPSLEESLLFFMNDYNHAANASADFDAKLRNNATALVSSRYADLVSLITRQVYSGIEITVGKSSAAAYSPNDIKVFMKEISTSNYVNTVDVIYPSFPFWIATNPSMLRYLIEPVLEYVAAGVYPHPWAPHDLGKVYPIVNGHPDGEDGPYYVEESANMLIMTLAYTSASSDEGLISDYYATLKQWADYLVDHALYPTLQASTDDFAGETANLTNLALKGIIGISAMGKIANLAKQSTDRQHYYSTARSYAEKFLDVALSSDGTHLKATYDSDDNSYTLAYNLYADKLLQLNTFDESIYTMLEEYYPSIKQEWGFAIDSRGPYAKTDWTLFAAGAHASDPTTRDLFVDSLYNWLNYGSTSQPTPDLWNPTNASTAGFVDRPVVGGVYSLLALKTLGALQQDTSAGVLKVSSSAGPNLPSQMQSGSQDNGAGIKFGFSISVISIFLAMFLHL